MENILKGKFGPLLIAEIGGNHEGNFEYAKKLCQLAIESDADLVKFQIYTGNTLVSPVESPDRNKHFKKFELSKEQHIELAKMVLAAGKRYTASIWDPSILDWIDPYVDLYKIGSGDLTAYAMIGAIIEKRKPIIISTGLATEEEVLATVGYIQSLNPMYKMPENLAILQCTSMYPIPYTDANLNVMLRLKEKTGLTIGYSDHTEGSKALHYATAMGAEILEFHFTDTKEGKTFRDHLVSLTKEDVHALIEELQVINLLKGSKIKRPTQIEFDTDHVKSFRRGTYFKNDVEIGHVIKEDDLVFLRPNVGLDARNYKGIIGKTIEQPIKAFERIDIDKIK
ncbi:N-acetylneuraminate synthase family protein [Sphingobacterium sp.]|uniref:N-acetylneuraminate synthase family protein n=1 Tax=Sphingobacterium sp. TaxID=341027 RepID=UPI00289D05BB|nr:N-acetylneuraminate synthase family protein [Sphingobacterium sp.]